MAFASVTSRRREGVRRMARRITGWWVLTCAVLAVSGCTKVAAPPPSRTAPGSVATTPARATDAVRDVPTPAQVKPPKSTEPPAGSALELSPPTLVLEPGDPGWQWLARKLAGGSERVDPTPR